MARLQGKLSPRGKGAVPGTSARPEQKTPPQRRRRRILIIAVILALLAYPVLGTLALWTGLAERLIASEDLRVEIENPAYTIWPGHIHAKHLRVLVNGETQFSLDGDDIVVVVRLFPLIQRRVHVTKLAAEGVRYRMRVQVEDTKGIEERIAAYPPLKELPGADAVREKTAAKTEEREASFTVEVEGIDIAVDELWFFEYRYLGDGRLRGGFKVGPQVMRVTTAVQDLGPGELRFGAEQVIAKNLRGQITANIPEVNPEKHADASFMELVTARVNLRADVQTLAHVRAYLDGIEVSRGAGPFASDLHLDKGLLGTQSHMSFETEALGVKGHGFGVQTDWRIEFDADGEKAKTKDGQQDAVFPLVRSTSRSTYASIAERDREFTVQVHGHAEEAALDTIKLSGATDLRRAAVRMPKIVSVDLDDMDVLFGEGAPVDVRAGELHGAVNLTMDEEYWVRGPMEFRVDGLKMEAAGVRIHGNTRLEGKARVNPKQKANLLENFALELRGVGMHVGDEHVDGWWMNITSPRLAFWNTTPPRHQSTISIRAKDLEPVLEGLAEKDVINDLIAKFTSLDDFRCKLTVRGAGETTDVIMESESDVWDASGRIYMKGEQNRMAVVVGGQAVSVGIASAGDGVEIMPFAKTGWLNERLRAFPKPVELPPSKP